MEQCESSSTSSSWFNAVNANDVSSVESLIQQQQADVNALEVHTFYLVVVFLKNQIKSVRKNLYKTTKYCVKVYRPTLCNISQFFCTLAAYK